MVREAPEAEPSGWYFEFSNEFYPDIDDTAWCCSRLSNSKARSGELKPLAKRRAVHWLLEMQGKDGGWAAFDVDNDWGPLSYVPFADHNAMLDPSCPDITGRVLEALCAVGSIGSSRCPQRHPLSAADPGTGRQLVWPLGRRITFTAHSSPCVA